MRTVYSEDRGTRYALAGATDNEKAGAVLLGATEARARAKAGQVYCADRHCEEPLIFKQYRELDRAPYFAHMPGASENCGEAGGPEGAWHRFTCRDLLGRALAHEHAVPGARADLVVRRCNNTKMIAVEVQHSDIKPQTVRKRNVAHRAAGLVATYWIVDGSVAVPGIDTAAWVSEDPARRSTGWRSGCRGSLTYSKSAPTAAVTGRRWRY